MDLINEEKSDTTQSNNIESLDDDENNTKKAFLVGWNFEEKKEVSFEVDFDSLIELSNYAKETIESDKELQSLIIPVKGNLQNEERVNDNKNTFASHDIVEKLSIWINHYKDNPNTAALPIIDKPIRDTDFSKIIRITLSRKNLTQEDLDREVQWYVDFFNIKNINIFKLVHAANYLDITSTQNREGLLKVGAMYIASQLKGKNPEEIKHILKSK